MFGIPVWFVVSAFACVAALLLYVVLVDRVYTTHLPHPDGITWDAPIPFAECDHCTAACMFDTCPAIN